MHCAIVWERAASWKSVAAGSVDDVIDRHRPHLSADRLTTTYTTLGRRVAQPPAPASRARPTTLSASTGRTPSKMGRTSASTTRRLIGYSSA
jgi:hypothetical protein